MALAVGIAGLPNVGKSTLLNALTHAHAEASNYPFCTIEQNVGVAAVPDRNLARLQEILSLDEAVPTTIRFVDIAGLVAGASRGEGLGNKFLGHIRDVDAILHVVRTFQESDVPHAPGPPDPVRDVEIVETEFLLADLEVARRALDRLEKSARLGKGAHPEEQAIYRQVIEGLEAGTPVSALGLGAEGTQAIAESRFLTAKPVLYVANTGEDDPAGGGALPRALREARGEDRVIPVSVRIEEEISQLPPEEQGEFLEGMGLEETALDIVVTACYRLLDLVTFYTIAHDKLTAWQLRRGGTAAEAAGKIHSDMEQGFIRAEVMALEDLLREGSRQALHDHGLIKVVGRDHPVQDRDILHIHFKA